MAPLLLLFTVGVTGIAVIVCIVALLRRKPMTGVTGFMTFGAAAWLVAYAGLLVGSSLASKPRLLALNEQKAFCGFYLDCHLHAAVTRADDTMAVGPHPGS